MEFAGRDAARFLGVKGTPDAETLGRLADAAAEVRAAAEPRETHRFFPLRADPDAGEIAFEGAFRVRSRSLARNLARSPGAFLFVATLGPGPDRLVRRAQAVGAMADAALLQAAAAELADSWCDDVCAALARLPEAAGRALRPRFSPGYGDCPLATQRDLFAALDATRRIGVSLTDAFLMVPTKSVSAFVGVADATPR